MEKINWMVFEGSSHCLAVLAESATGQIETFGEFEKLFMPGKKNK